MDISIVWGSFLGGSGRDVAFSIATDQSDLSLNIVGETNSSDFPITPNSNASGNKGGNDGFLSKFNEGGPFIRSNLIGGSGDDSAYSITNDQNGNSYVTGTTASSDFPGFGTDGNFSSFNSYRGGPSDGFVLKTNVQFDIEWNLLLGGSPDAIATGEDQLFDIYIDPPSSPGESPWSGNIFVTGFTDSNNFPVHKDAEIVGPTFFDAFIVQLEPDGTFVTTDFYGGRGIDYGYGISVGNGFNQPGFRQITIVGHTFSNDLFTPGWSNPLTSPSLVVPVEGTVEFPFWRNGGEDTIPNGFGDGFIATYYNETSTSMRISRECFINQQYRDFLDRDAEPAGLDFYQQNLASGAMSLNQMVANFIYSPEFADNNGFLARAVLALFNNNYTLPPDDPDYIIPAYAYMAAAGEFMDNFSGTQEEAKLAVVEALIDSPGIQR